MALEMRAACEKCAQPLPQNASDAYICSYECTWCAPCAHAMNLTCPNCGGDLQRRPSRKKED